jgi:hypothetical protein
LPSTTGTVVMLMGISGKIAGLKMMRAGWSSKNNQLGIGEALGEEREDPMGDALAIQTIVIATETVFFEAATIVSDVRKIIFVTQKIFLIPENMFFANEKTFWSAGNIFPVAQKII